ncbi:alcohol dehydrogenase catalytic domain-containing protein [Pseudonocardia ailaonensis]|uniref:alcohol dehydrogenase catalytic domain-containing protein n=1 Tax=Pseudonocardia ailaonensis TaxID=367279 RepID=UPI003CD0993F
MRRTHLWVAVGSYRRTGTSGSALRSPRTERCHHDVRRSDGGRADPRLRRRVGAGGGDRADPRAGSGGRPGAGPRGGGHPVDSLVRQAAFAVSDRPLPWISGRDFAGTVVAVGSARTAWSVGDVVAAAPPWLGRGPTPSTSRSTRGRSPPPRACCPWRLPRPSRW